MLVRHIDGKSATSAAAQSLYLNYASSNDVYMVYGGGKVGIGTISASGKLHVKDTTTDASIIVETAGGNDAVLELIAPAAAGAESRLAFSDDTTRNVGSINYAHNSGGTDYMGFRAASTERMRITTSGVGIGTSQPDFELQVENTVAAGSDNFILNVRNTTHASDSRAGIAFRMNNNTSTNWDGAGIQAYNNGVDGAGHLGFGSVLNDTFSEHVRIKSDGKVGIGTNAPIGPLTVKSSATSSTDSAINVAANGSADTIFAIGERATNGAQMLLYDGGTATHAFYTDGTANYINAGNVGIGTTSPSNALDVVGHFSATSKSFVIDHPTKENKKLQYGSLEGPENGVYVRGTTNSKIIELPEYWSELVHEDSITVVLTPIGKKQSLYIKSKTPENVMVGGVEGSYDYVIYGERKDIDRLEVEPDGN